MSSKENEEVQKKVEEIRRKMRGVTKAFAEKGEIKFPIKEKGKPFYVS